MTAPTPTRSQDAQLEIVVSKVTSMEAALVKLTEAMARLTAMEVHQQHTNTELTRAFREIDKCSATHSAKEAAQAAEYRLLQLRIAALELQTPLTKQTSEWVTGAVWACVAVLGVFLAKKVGLM